MNDCQRRIVTGYAEVQEVAASGNKASCMMIADHMKSRRRKPRPEALCNWQH